MDNQSDSISDKILENEKQTQEILESARQHFEEIKAEADEIIKALREASADLGVSKYAETFSSEVVRLKRESLWWILVTALFATASLSMAIWFWNSTVTVDMSLTQVVHLLVSKGVIFGLLFGSTIWCGKHFRATKHQEVVNRHRANALKTFQAFVQATIDSATKEAVLLETTRSIFTIASSGYLNSSDSANVDKLKVIEMIKGITGQDPT